MVVNICQGPPPFLFKVPLTGHSSGLRASGCKKDSQYSHIHTENQEIKKLFLLNFFERFSHLKGGVVGCIHAVNLDLSRVSTVQTVEL